MLSEDKIYKGDTVYNTEISELDGVVLFEADEKTNYSVVNSDKNNLKVIGSTNGTISCGFKANNNTEVLKSNLPIILSEFIIAYIERYNRNSSVMVDVVYEKYNYHHTNFNADGRSVKNAWGDWRERPMIGKYNSIIIDSLVNTWDVIFNHPTALKLTSQEALKIWLKDNFEPPTDIKITIHENPGKHIRV